jgi:hypothetical protein
MRMVMAFLAICCDSQLVSYKLGVPDIPHNLEQGASDPLLVLAGSS